MRSYLKKNYRLRSRKLRLTTVGYPPHSPRETSLSSKVWRYISPTSGGRQSVHFAYGQRATEFVFCFIDLILYSCPPCSEIDAFNLKTHSRCFFESVYPSARLRGGMKMNLNSVTNLGSFTPHYCLISH
jgi:hypothetical protein